jgi:hypothetical protein
MMKHASRYGLLNLTLPSPRKRRGSLLDDGDRSNLNPRTRQ